jgi:hypothetical protein
MRLEYVCSTDTPTDIHDKFNFFRLVVHIFDLSCLGIAF